MTRFCYFYKDRDTKMPSVLMPIEYKGGEEAGAIICLSKPQCFSDIYMFLGSDIICSLDLPVLRRMTEFK